MDKEQPQAKTEAPVDTAEPVFHDNSNKSTPTGLIICMVLLVLIAIGGVGFGVWEMVSQSQKVKDLETQVANCAAVNDDEEEASEKDENTEDYIYIGEWGLKIKKPENWRNMITEYSFVNGAPQGMDSFDIRESTTPGDGVTILKQTSCLDSLDPERAVYIEFDDATYVVGKMVGELTPGAEDVMTDEFWSFITDLDNYSEI